jgi:hypothetical protein
MLGSVRTNSPIEESSINPFTVSFKASTLKKLRDHFHSFAGENIFIAKNLTVLNATTPKTKTHIIVALP